jgi:hypothetical protein
MTDVYGTPEKVRLKRRLFEIGLETLKSMGYTVERAQGGSSVRRVTKDGESKLVSIRTTQDRYIAFPRKKDGAWRTLDEVDIVVAVSVDDREAPRYAWVHLLPGDEMRDRFRRSYEARKALGLKMPPGRGIWLSLYKKESTDNPRRVGAGAGLAHPRVATVSLAEGDNGPGPQQPIVEPPVGLTITEAKRLLAKSLGVNESSIKITVEA